MPEVLYLDSSVAIHVLVGTASARRWWNEHVDAGTALLSSQLLDLEVARYLRREDRNLAEADFLRASVNLLGVDNALLAEAAKVPAVLKTLDCLHLASAARVGTSVVTLATHDHAMSAAAQDMGFTTVDPVTA